MYHVHARMDVAHHLLHFLHTRVRAGKLCDYHVRLCYGERAAYHEQELHDAVLKGVAEKGYLRDLRHNEEKDIH